MNVMDIEWRGNKKAMKNQMKMNRKCEKNENRLEHSHDHDEPKRYVFMPDIVLAYVICQQKIQVNIKRIASNKCNMCATDVRIRLFS